MSGATLPRIVVSAAIVERDGQFLVTRRPRGVHLEGGAGHDVAVNTIIDWRKNALDHKKYPDLYRAYCTVIDLTEWSAPLPCAEKLVAQLIKLHAQKGG